MSSLADLKRKIALEEQKLQSSIAAIRHEVTELEHLLEPKQLLKQVLAPSQKQSGTTINKLLSSILSGIGADTVHSTIVEPALRQVSLFATRLGLERVLASQLGKLGGLAKMWMSKASR